MDEVHFEVKARGKFMQNHRSHKTQKPSIGYIFICTQDMIINFVSKSWNVQKHSMGIMSKIAEPLKAEFDPNDVITIDSGFQGVEKLV